MTLIDTLAYQPFISHITRLSPEQTNRDCKEPKLKDLFEINTRYVDDVQDYVQIFLAVYCRHTGTELTLSDGYEVDNELGLHGRNTPDDAVWIQTATQYANAYRLVLRPKGGRELIVQTQEKTGAADSKRFAQMIAAMTHLNLSEKKPKKGR